MNDTSNENDSLDLDLATLAQATAGFSRETYWVCAVALALGLTGCVMEAGGSAEQTEDAAGAVAQALECKNDFDSCVYQTSTQGPWWGSYSNADQTCRVVGPDGKHHAFARGHFTCEADPPKETPLQKRNLSLDLLGRSPIKGRPTYVLPDAASVSECRYSDPLLCALLLRDPSDSVPRGRLSE